MKKITSKKNYLQLKEKNGNLHYEEFGLIKFKQFSLKSVKRANQ